MLNWVKVEAGKYRSGDDRFQIVKTCDSKKRWRLTDTYDKEYYRGTYHGETLLQCKFKAEGVLAIEKRLAEIRATNN